MGIFLTRFSFSKIKTKLKLKRNPAKLQIILQQIGESINFGAKYTVDK